MQRQSLALRGALLCVLALGAVIVLAPRAPQHARTLGGATSFDEVLGASLTLVLLATSTWVLCCAALLVVDAGRSPWLRAVCPAFLVAALVASPAARAAAPSLDGLRLPDRPVSAPAPQPSAGQPARPGVTVRRGDSLWAIAERHLSAGATAADIAHAVREWYARNRQVIGPDPDLIHPGMRLHPPRHEGSA